MSFSKRRIGGARARAAAPAPPCPPVAQPRRHPLTLNGLEQGHNPSVLESPFFYFLGFFVFFLGLDEKSNENNKKEKKEKRKRKRKRGKMEGKQLRYDRGGEVTRWFAHLHKLGGG